VGGGPTGVEIAGALADFRMQELDILYPEMDPGTLQVTVLQRGDELLKEFSTKYRQYAADELRDRGVTLQLGRGVKEVGYDHVVLDDGSILESDITIWAAGVAIPKSVSEWGFPQDKRGRLAVDDYLQVKGFPGVYAAGDIAGQDEPLPQLAQPAIQTGQAAARAIAAEVAGKPRKKFTYTNLGTLAPIGRPPAPPTSRTPSWERWTRCTRRRSSRSRPRTACSAGTPGPPARPGAATNRRTADARLTIPQRARPLGRARCCSTPGARPRPDVAK